MTLPLHERRGLNRQQSIEYLGIKGSYFDKEIRPMLAGMRMGTSVVFDRRDLDTVFDQLKVASRDVGPMEKGATQWPKESLVSPKRKMDGGESTSSLKELDFKAVSERIKRQRPGC